MEAKKMKKKRIFYLLLTSFVCMGFVMDTILVYGAEEGGRVQSKAGVGFYEASTESSTKSSSTSDSQSSQSTSYELKAEKPTGKLPETGELVKKSLFISGSILVVLILIFFFYKRKKEKRSKRL